MYQMPKLDDLVPDINYITLSYKEVRAMSDDELLQLLGGDDDRDGIITAPTMQLISAELAARSVRRAARPHWSVVPAFWLLVIAVLLSLLGVVTAALSLPYTQTLLEKNTATKALEAASPPTESPGRSQADEGQ